MLNSVYKWVERLLFIILLAVTAQFGYCLVVGADFVFGDQLELLEIFIEGKIPFRIVSGNGRFWPLIKQEFRPLFALGLDETTLITGLFAYNFVKLSFMLTFVWLALRRLVSSLSATCVCLLLLLLTNSLFWMFAQPQGTESTVLLLWAAWFYFYVRAEAGNNGLFYLLAGLAAGVSFYLKETAFILFLPSSLVLLFFNFKRLAAASKLYHFFILFQIFIFLGLYYWFSYRLSDTFYNEGRTLLSRAEIFLFYCRENKLIIPVIGFMVWRGFDFIRKRENKISTADVLMLNALAFIASYVVLKMNAGYYILPAAPPILIGLFLHIRALRPRLPLIIKWNSAHHPVAVGALAIAIALMSGVAWKHYKRHNRADMKALRVERLNTRETLAVLAALKKSGYTFLSYLPPENYFYRNTFEWHQIAWSYGALQRFVRFYSRDYDYQYRYISASEGVDTGNRFPTLINAAWLADQSLPKDAWLVSPDSRLVEKAFPRSADKVLLLEMPGRRDYFDDLAIDKSYAISTPLVDLYFSTPPPVKAEDWVSEIDVRRLHYSRGAFISGLSATENWGRWSDGRQVTLALVLPETLRGKPLSIDIPVLQVLGRQRVMPSLNGRQLPDFELERPTTMSFAASPEETQTGELKLALQLPDARSPGPDDQRLLGIGFRSIKITPGADSAKTDWREEIDLTSLEPASQPLAALPAPVIFGRWAEALQLIFVSGLGESESWGRRVLGPQVRVKAVVPEFLRGRRLRLDISPVRLRGEQVFRPSINGRPLPESRLSSPGSVSLSAKEEETESGQIDLVLDCPDAQDEGSELGLKSIVVSVIQ